MCNKLTPTTLAYQPFNHTHDVVLSLPSAATRNVHVLFLDSHADCHPSIKLHPTLATKMCSCWVKFHQCSHKAPGQFHHIMASPEDDPGVAATAIPRAGEPQMPLAILKIVVGHSSFAGLSSTRQPMTPAEGYSHKRLARCPNT